MILFWGTLLVAVAAGVWVQTRDSRAWWGLLLAVGLVVIAVLVERWVVTPGEEVKATLRTIARRLEANDVQGVLPYISPQSEPLRQEVRGYLRRVKVESISIKPNLTVTVGPQRPARSAEARFNAVATLEGPANFGGRFTVPRFMVVRFRREGEGWRVTDYESYDPRGPQAGR
jgi:hypothetical protein